MRIFKLLAPRLYIWFANIHICQWVIKLIAIGFTHNLRISLCLLYIISILFSYTLSINFYSWGRPPQRGFIWGRPPQTRFYEGLGETAPNAVLWRAGGDRPHRGFMKGYWEARKLFILPLWCLKKEPGFSKNWKLKFEYISLFFQKFQKFFRNYKINQEMYSKLKMKK